MRQGLDLTGKLLLDEGDVVLCESPTYLGAISAWNTAATGAGINIAVVRAAIKARPPLKRPVQVFVFVGDTPPSDIGPPVDGITVHRVRADGSLWP